MAIKRPDIYEHNNPLLPIVDADNVKGATKIVPDQTAMLAIPVDKLKEGTKAIYKVGSDFITYELLDISNPTVIGSWRLVETTTPGDLSTKLDKGTYTGNAQDLADLIDTKAELAGDSTQTFEVADGVAAKDAVNVSQLDSLTASINQSKFFGAFVDLAALNAATPQPTSPGWYAILDIVGQDAKKYIFDFTDTVWVESGSVLTGQEIKTLLFAVADTNNLTDALLAEVNKVVDKADKANVLEKDNTTPYTPTADHHPVTKAFLESQIQAGTATGLEAPEFRVALSDGKKLGKYSNGDLVPGFTTIQAQLRDIAQETINPNLIAPTFSVGLDNTVDREVGFLYVNPLMTGTFNPGEIEGDLVGGIWDPNATQDTRAGAVSNNGYVFDGNVGQNTNSLVIADRQIMFGDNTFTGSVAFETGPQPLNSANPRGNYSTPLIANTLVASVNVRGRYMNFFGTSLETSLTSAQIINLSNKDLDTNRSRSYSGVTASGGTYTYYCYPASYGDLSNLILDGSSSVLGSLTKLPNVLVTNQYGQDLDYIVYRTNAQNAFTNNSLNFI